MPRSACRFESEPWCPDFVRAIHRANFAEDREISDPEVVRACVAEVGLLADEILERASLPDAKEKLRAQADRAAAFGIFGAPSFVVADELFWGNDRLEAALAWCRSPAPQAQQTATWRGPR